MCCNTTQQICCNTTVLLVIKIGQKKPPFHFHKHQELKQKWIYFVNCKDWLPTAHSVICIDQFEEKFIKRGKKCQLLCCGKYIQYLQ